MKSGLEQLMSSKPRTMHNLMKTTLSLFPLLVCLIGEVTSSCSMTDDVCEFWLEIEHHLTMMDYKTAVYPANGKLYKYNVRNISAAEPVDPDKVITADGWERTRLVVTANKTMPGPPIEVYEGQTIIVHVKNLMTGAAVTVHWHGLHQKGTPWMDGVAFVTQCPIESGQTFTYKFEAYPRGTFWYHSHIGSQLSMGLFGALIIRERIPPPMEEFIMMMQDWNHDMDGDLIHLRMVYGNYENREKIPPTRSLEGAEYSMFNFHSGLINGRGRFYFPNGSHNEAPLTVYHVTKDKPYRFRVIGAGNLYPFRISVDNHTIKLLASDGFDLAPIVVESFIINPGERYDFELLCNQTVGNYWIRAVTLEVNVENHIAQAVLRYEGAPDEDPTTQAKQCSEDDRCLVVNCPFSYYPEGTYTDCMNFGQITSKQDYKTPGGNKEEEIEDKFLNFAFPGTTWTPGAVNGRAFQVPEVSALTQPHDITTACNPDECGVDKVCKCSFSIDLEHNKVYQMVFLNMGNGKGWAHPIHMHGHSFHVVKTGYPTYNTTTGKFLQENLDIDCGGNPDRTKSFCNHAKWANSSWGGNNIPGLNLETAPLKDTIMVPTGGYVVVRIRADNPGLWFMHCHIELHNLDGMAVMLNESYPKHAPPPIGFPTCGDFHYNTDQHTDKKETNNDETYDKELFWIVVGCLLAVVVLQLIVIIFILSRRSSSKAKFELGSSNYANKAFNGT